MAGILFVYTRSSIYAAKRNAERHRAADGGQISWFNESQRRHGALEKPEEQNSLRQILFGAKSNTAKVAEKDRRMTEDEGRLRASKWKPGDGQT